VPVGLLLTTETLTMMPARRHIDTFRLSPTKLAFIAHLPCLLAEATVRTVHPQGKRFYPGEQGAVTIDASLSTYGTMPGLQRGQQQAHSCGTTAPHAVSVAVMAMGHTHKNTALWLPSEGVLLYAVDNTVVVDELRTRRQRYLVLNKQNVTALAASGASSSTVAIAVECVASAQVMS
jgi:hypothetical protein